MKQTRPYSLLPTTNMSTKDILAGGKNHHMRLSLDVIGAWLHIVLVQEGNMLSPAPSLMPPLRVSEYAIAHVTRKQLLLSLGRDDIVLHHVRDFCGKPRGKAKAQRMCYSEVWTANTHTG